MYQSRVMRLPCRRKNRKRYGKASCYDQHTGEVSRSGRFSGTQALMLHT